MCVYLVVCVCRLCMYICCRYCITVECTVLYSIDMMQCSPPDNCAVEPVGSVYVFIQLVVKLMAF